MEKSDSTRLWVKWNTKDPMAVGKIRRRFGIPDYTTLNGLSPAEISSEDMPIFLETARRGFISVINEKWCKNGDLYSFSSRIK